MPVVQLISLIFKDQHVRSLQEFLTKWMENSMLDDSSEDNESNTSSTERADSSDNSADKRIHSDSSDGITMEKNSVDSSQKDSGNNTVEMESVKSSSDSSLWWNHRNA